MNPWRPILAALVIFATGVITGGLLVTHANQTTLKNRRPVVRDNVRPATNPVPTSNMATARDPQARPPGALLPNRVPRVISEEFVRRLETELQLTSGQRERIHDIIAEGQERNKEAWDRIAPDLRREMVETQRRIREILTVEQRAQFEELMKKNRPPTRRKADEPAPPVALPRN